MKSPTGWTWRRCEMCADSKPTRADGLETPAVPAGVYPAFICRGCWTGVTNGLPTNERCRVCGAQAWGEMR